MSNRHYTRRSFMRTLGVLGIGAAVMPTPAMAVMRLTDVRRLSDHRFEVAETRFLMGTFVAITARHASRTKAEHAVGLAYAEIERLSAIFDRHRTDTALSHLNATGRLCDVDPELRAVMNKAVDYNRLTQGAYDATVLPIVQILRQDANPSGRMRLDDKRLNEALALVDSGAIRVSAREICLEKTGMGVTLDGMGKGYIVDCASDVLLKNGIADHLVNAGGDMRARGERAPGKAWTIAIEDPKGQKHYPAVIPLRDAAIATSGGYESSFDASGSHHHVVDPRTARSPLRSVSVSVVAPTVMQADALSTAVFVMSPHDGVSLIDSLSGCECLIVGNTNAFLSSRGWDRTVKA